MLNGNFNTSYSTLTLLIIKEIRLESKIHPSFIAHCAGKTPSEWDRIESGKERLTIDMLPPVCRAINKQTSYIMSLAEILERWLTAYGYYINPSPLEHEKDDLLEHMKNYYKSDIHQTIRDIPFISIERIQLYNPYMPHTLHHAPAVIRYCCDPNFKNKIDNNSTTSSNME